MKALRISTACKKDLKRARRRAYDLALLADVVDTLRRGEALPAARRDHELKGAWRGARECHIQPDWLLIYQASDTEIALVRTGTHADLFER
ncbi:putative addiction module toxin [Hyphomicrobium denitrificans 1NES1]|uniref:Putative addiction module toxin n=1 Tax=Hyphomicrobium denitrificans 1NES1 TaxID=670307 RepID=N0B966_9HYPH|nr:type II toxin-antitoxin system YafQ family toxin [Hyphomicrobium denitrificans]AGK57061.1 putative addiction module toxin [Hyphomicrobium denitrificans 1NES1]